MVGRRKLIVVSNRGTVTFDRDADFGNRVARRGGGGGVTTLRSLVSHHDVTWVASAITDADREVAEGSGEALDETAAAGRPTGCGWSSTTRRRTTVTTTSSRTRCCGFSSTISGVSRSAPSIDQGAKGAGE